MGQKVNILLGDNKAEFNKLPYNFQEPFNRDICVRGGRESNNLVSQENIKSLGHNTQIHTHSHIKKHTTTQPNRETHKLSHKHTTSTQTSSTQTMAMYVKNPKHHFGYHDISNSNINNQNLRLSKKHNSKKITQNTSST